MKIDLKSKSITSYFGCVAAVLALVIIIVGPITRGFADRSFSNEVIAVLVIGIIAEIATFLTDTKAMPLVTAIIFAVGIGFIFMNAAPIVADRYNDLNFRNGDFNSVVVYLVLGSLMGITSVVACFGDKNE